MRISRVSAVAISCLLGFFASVFAVSSASGQTPPPAAAQKPNKKQILDKARKSYYVLQDEGLKSFQCVIQPNWKQLLAYLTEKLVTADDPRLAQLGAVQYSAVVDDSATAKVTALRPAGVNFDSSLEQIIGEGQQVVEGFFKSCVPMVVSSAFPEAQDPNYDLSDQPDGYHFGQKVGDTSIELVLTRDSVLTAMKVSSSTANVVMLPKYSKTEKGLLLSGVDTDINKGTQVVNFQVQYQKVEGFQLPDKVSYQVILPSEKTSFEMTFSKYQLTRR